MTTMGTTWGTIFPDLDDQPVRGQLVDYRSARTESRRLAEASGHIEAEFARIVSSDEVAELRGDTARALVNVIDEVDSSLRDLPPLFETLTTIFDQHATELAELRRCTTEALARATTRWNDLLDAQRVSQQHGSTLEAIDGQLRSLQRQPASAENDELIDEYERRFNRQQSTVREWDDEVAAARLELASSRSEHQRLVADEAELIRRTIERFDDVDLGDLKDPGRLQQFVSDVVSGLVSFGADLIEGIVDLAVAGLALLADALLTLANFVFIEALRLLALAIKGVLTVLVALALTVLTMALLGLASALVALAIMMGPLGIIALAFGVQKLLAFLNAEDPRTGDPGGTYDVEGRDEYDQYFRDLYGNDEQGRAVIMQGLDLTGNGGAIAEDEFGLIRTEDGKYILILPGVTDLSRPDIGLNDYNRTVRDVDQHALPSSSSTSIDDNLYAQMVMEAMQRYGVPPGAEVMIIGHSYGADTALDLAADPRFNGEGAYNVTHVMAAAYNSGPQLASVPSSTNVLVVQNAHDAAVNVENFGYDGVGAVDSFNDALDSFIDRDPVSGFGELGQTGEHLAGTDANVRVPGVTSNGSQTTVVFDGGTTGAGHHQDNYTDYFGSHNSFDVAAFEASVGAAGYGAPGDFYAIDVSIPVPR